ncbi:hypothetical protein H311_02054 [Anncaliia algerae PRA109]|nr:hypothetical protein H311_02054 [Anncaliia algerae PRA109]
MDEESRLAKKHVKLKIINKLTNLILQDEKLQILRMF